MKTFAHLKTLASESIVYGLSGVLTKFLYFILVPVYTRIFQPEDYGVMSLVTNTMTLVSIFVVLGLDSATARWFYDTEDEEQRKGTIATWAWCQIAISVLIAVCIVAGSDFLSRTLVGGHSDAAKYFRLSAITLPLSALGAVITNWLRLLRRPWTTIFFSLGTNALTIGLIFCFAVFLKWGLTGVYFAQMVTAFISAIIAALLMGQWVNPLRFDIRQLKEMLLFALPLIPASLSYWVVNLSGLYFIKNYSSTAEVGLYQVGSSIASAMAMITSSFQQAWGPFALSIYQRDDAKNIYADTLTAYTLFTCFSSLCLTMFAPDILALVTTKAYLGASRVVGILAFNYVVIGLAYIAVIGATIAKTTRPYGIATVCASVVTIALNFILVPRFGKEGSALATLIAQSFVPFYLFYQSQKLCTIPYRFTAVAETMALAVTFAVAGSLVATGVAIVDVGIKVLIVGIFIISILAFRITTLTKIKSLVTEFRILKMGCNG